MDGAEGLQVWHAADAVSLCNRASWAGLGASMSSWPGAGCSGCLALVPVWRVGHFAAAGAGCRLLMHLFLIPALIARTLPAHRMQQGP